VNTSLARAVLDPADAARAAAFVVALRRRHPRESRDAIASRLIHRAARRCAAGGALLSAPAAFFGGLPFGLDLTYQVVVLNRLVLSLAVLYADPGASRERVTGTAAAVAAALSSEALRQAVVAGLRRISPRRPVGRASAGAILGGALGYGAAVVVGGVARDLFAARSRRRVPWLR
jgi:hypothetical protein